MVTRSPLRISFIGGGTDFPKYFEDYGGFFVSTAINRYIYCTIKKHSTSFRENFRLNYSENELVEETSEIKNEIIRGSLKRFSRENFLLDRLYIGTVGDIRSNSGLGSSSAFSCSLDLALAQLTKKPNTNPIEIAQRACQLEIYELNKAIGIQDQWSSAHGGLRQFEILKNGSVKTETVKLTSAQATSINSCLLLVDTGQVRKAENISQNYNIPNSKQQKIIQTIHEKAIQFPAEITRTSPIEIPEMLADCLKSSWELKKSLSSKISNLDIDSLYNQMIRYGCLGGKILGAGGGGYLLMIVPVEKIESIESKLQKENILFDRPAISESGTEVLIKC